MADEVVVGGMVGSATRFKGANQIDSSQGQATFSDAKTGPDSFNGIRTGPDFSIEYETATAAPVDGSDPLLRNLSPFMLQVEPPMVYAHLGDMGGNQKRDPGSIVTSAQGVSNPFASARSALQSSPLGMDRAGTQRGVEQSISTNADVQSAKGGQGKVSTGPSGRASGRLGTPSIADLKTAQDIASQIKAAVNTPPLILLINPSSISMNMSKIQQFQDRTRHGFVFQAWGEEQPVLSIETRCGAFYSAGRGVQWASRRESASWNNLMSLFQLYKNNGYIYDTVGKSNAHHLVGTLSIHYDGWIYYGNMSSFSWTYEETNQLGGVSVSMEFTVSWMVDTSKAVTSVLPMQAPTVSPSDPRYLGFSNPSSSEYPMGVDGSPNTMTSVVPGGSDSPSLVGRASGFNNLPTGVMSSLTVAPGTGNFSPAEDTTVVSVQTATKPGTPFGFA